jgi:hypothetical protein
MWISSGILELTTSGTPQESEQLFGSAGSGAPHLSFGGQESSRSRNADEVGMGSSGRSASGKEGGDPSAVSDSGGRMSDSHRPRPGHKESVATADKEEDDTPLEMQEVVAEKSDIAEDFDVNENPPDEPLAENTIELLENISGDQSADRPDAQLEIDVDNEPAAEPVEDDSELADQALYAFASNDDENDF